ncbi:hypothetical protein Pla52n_57600 [Stieleria varia]|uniref:Uncharacterized protein n=1 Tax=Stieleria varia TaxID=2528005 RepID=A0A5C6A249_9BACT|nr:hypothetical protein Pla52n_57600 [Stieleria varia]
MEHNIWSENSVRLMNHPGSFRVNVSENLGGQQLSSFVRCLFLHRQATGCLKTSVKDAIRSTMKIVLETAEASTLRIQ